MNTCYLCGYQIENEIDCSRDHVPPRQFFPKAFRDTYPDGFWVLPTHKKCNTSYQRDEDYFFFSSIPLTAFTPMEAEMWGELQRRINGDVENMEEVKAKGRVPRSSLFPLLMRINDEFKDRTPEGIVMPKGNVVKDFDWPRTHKVLWKIVRGLFFKDYGRVLKEDLPHQINNVRPGKSVPDCFVPVIAETPKGQYRKYFDYVVKEGKVSDGHFYSWGLAFWNSLGYFVSFTNPDCTCTKCHKGRA